MTGKRRAERRPDRPGPGAKKASRNSGAKPSSPKRSGGAVRVAGRLPAVAVQWTGSKPFLTAAQIRRTARAALHEGGRTALRLSIAIVPDRELTRLHADWLADDSPTDVLSFDLSDEHSEVGEIVVSHGCARRTARARRVDPGRELALYIVHGILHLCGHDDHSPRDRNAMRAAEQRVLAALGWRPDLAPHDE